MKHYLIFLLLLLNAPLHAKWYKESRAIMGTSVHVELWSESAQQASMCTQRVMNEMERINQLMSPYIKTSELYRINETAALHPVKISKEMFELIKRSLEISKLSDGAFDITFASIGYKYDYRNAIKPSDEEIKSSLKRINYRHIKLDEAQQTIQFSMSGVRIDLGGIAKGYAVDNSIEILRQCGIDKALVSAGGDSRIIGDKNGRPWITGIRDPRHADKSVVAIPLSDTAVSTSGDYERYFEKDGVRYHHILSPKTGKSVGSTRSVTIIGPEATLTDALSTTVFVLGPTAGMKLVEKLPDIDAVIIDAEGKVYYSSGLIPPAPPTSLK